MGRGGDIEEFETGAVERFAVAEPESERSLGLSKRLRLFKEVIASNTLDREIDLSSDADQLIRPVLITESLDDFELALGSFLQALEPSMEDRYIRDKLYPLLYSATELDILNNDLNKAKDVALNIASSQAVWSFKDSPDAFQTLSEDSNPEDLVMLFRCPDPRRATLPLNHDTWTKMTLWRTLTPDCHLIFSRS